MNPKNSVQQLQEKWERGVERSIEEQSRESATSEEELKIAAAFRVRTRLQAGRTDDFASAAPSYIAPC